MMILVAGLICSAFGMVINQTADENTLLVDGHFYGILSTDIDEMGYITLILEPLEVDEFDTNPEAESPAIDPRIGPNETLLYKKPGFLVTIETGFDPEYDAEMKQKAAEREKALEKEPVNDEDQTGQE